MKTETHETREDALARVFLEVLLNRPDLWPDIKPHFPQNIERPDILAASRAVLGSFETPEANREFLNLLRERGRARGNLDETVRACIDRAKAIRRMNVVGEALLAKDGVTIEQLQIKHDFIRNYRAPAVE